MCVTVSMTEPTIPASARPGCDRIWDPTDRRLSHAAWVMRCTRTLRRAVSHTPTISTVAIVAMRPSRGSPALDTNPWPVATPQPATSPIVASS
jgi:hypothetical protein